MNLRNEFKYAVSRYLFVGVMEIMIYVITHKDFDDSIVNKKGYRILHVGKNSNCKDWYLRDDTGDNISEKNPGFCELTGLYWIWKNAKEMEDDAVGLVHYRRFFTYAVDDLLYTYFNKKARLVSFEDIERGLKKHDVILPVPLTIARSVRGFYGDYHNPKDLIAIREVIEVLYPEYLGTFDRIMNGHHFYFGNMIITKRKLLNKYCEWLFSILEIVEKRIANSNIDDDYQSRKFGFLSERLIQVWIEHNRLRIKTYPVYNTEMKRLTFFQVNMYRARHYYAARKEK